MLLLDRTVPSLEAPLRKKRAVGWTAEYVASIRGHFLILRRAAPPRDAAGAAAGACRVVDLSGASTAADTKALTRATRARGFVLLLRDEAARGRGSSLRHGRGRSMRLLAPHAAAAAAWRRAIDAAVAAAPVWHEGGVFIDRGGVGEGAFGTVRRVRAGGEAGPEYALKVLPLGRGGWPTARVVEERLALERAGSHPHITVLHGAFLCGGCVLYGDCLDQRESV